MATGDVAIDLAAAVGQSLPAAYLTFLDELPNRPTRGEGYSPILGFEDRKWRPYDRVKLAEPYPGRRRDLPVPHAHQTARAAAELRAGDAESDGEMSAALVESGFSLDRLARSFCIGEDDNGEPLILDPETGGVYAYYHDGMDVEPWAESLDELLNTSQDWQDDDDDEDE